MDPRTEFLKRVDLSKTRINPFSGFIFLCGGAEDISSTTFVSVRDALAKELSNGRNSDILARLRLAEAIKDWYKDGIYGDLVTLEKHLASLASLIVLIVESPGSIAELGVFASLQPFSDRLLTVVSEHDHDQDSFIRLGPIKLLEDLNRPVLVYDWHSTSAGRHLADYTKIPSQLPDLLANIRQSLDKDLGQKICKLENPLHAMLLIVDLCHHFGALNVTEISSYLEMLDSNFESAVVRQYLFLLEKCEILHKKAKGHGRYYYTKHWNPRVSFSFKDRDSVDYDRLALNVIEFLDVSNRTRADVVRQVRGHGT